jgi:hypothetical protein
VSEMDLGLLYKYFLSLVCVYVGNLLQYDKWTNFEKIYAIFLATICIISRRCIFPISENYKLFINKDVIRFKNRYNVYLKLGSRDFDKDLISVKIIKENKTDIVFLSSISNKYDNNVSYIDSLHINDPKVTLLLPMRAIKYSVWKHIIYGEHINNVINELMVDIKKCEDSVIILNNDVNVSTLCVICDDLVERKFKNSKETFNFAYIMQCKHCNKIICEKYCNVTKKCVCKYLCNSCSKNSHVLAEHHANCHEFKMYTFYKLWHKSIYTSYNLLSCVPCDIINKILNTLN